jgi:hypothetical protein
VKVLNINTVVLVKGREVLLCGREELCEESEL